MTADNAQPMPAKASHRMPILSFPPFLPPLSRVPGFVSLREPRHPWGGGLRTHVPP